MRESIGATWIMGIVIVFLVLFSGYLAVSINYSKAFKVKDGIVERIEKYNGVNGCSIQSIKLLMDDIGYSSKGNCEFLFDGYDDTSLSSVSYLGVTSDAITICSTKGACSDNTFNYCILKSNASNVGEGVYQLGNNYYKVYVFFTTSLPVFNSSSIFRVSGESSVIVFPNDTCFSSTDYKCGGCSL